MGWLVTVVGVVLIVVALVDIFSTMWVPTGRGRLTRLLMVGVWRAVRGASRAVPLRGLLDRAGPLAMIGVVLTWALLLLLGGALVYGPHLPDGFSYPPDANPADRSDVLDAVYISVVTMATLGFGDIVPSTAWLRLAVPVQALLGFVLLTAVVSWVLQVYPALARRRTLSLRLAMLERACAGDPARAEETSTRAQLLHGLAADVATARVDLSQYPETYYYRDAARRTSLPVALGFAHVLACHAASAGREDVRLGGADLAEALDELADLLRVQFGFAGDVGEVLRAFAVDHRHEPASGLG